jgi:methyl-accepting chemotaxis protein
MQWFKHTTPIRLKLLVACALLWGFAAFVDVMFGLAGGNAGWIMALGVTGLSAVACGWFREAIAGPYVTTVVRTTSAKMSVLAEQASRFRILTPARCATIG